MRGDRYQVVEGKTPEIGVDKGGKSREIPVRHDLQGMLFTYLAAAELGDADGASPLFRSADGRTGRLTDRPVSPGDIARMVKRR